MSSDPSKVLRDVYWAGWVNAAEWANANDLLDDRGSEAYKKLEGEALKPALASLSTPKGDLTVEELAKMLEPITYKTSDGRYEAGLPQNAVVDFHLESAVAALNARLSEGAVAWFERTEKTASGFMKFDTGLLEGVNPETFPVGRTKLYAAQPGPTASESAGMGSAHLRDLLDEVRSHYTRDDDLPDNLLARIDAALAQGPAVANETLPDFLDRIAQELIARDDLPGTIAPGVAASLQGRASVVRNALADGSKTP